MGLRCSRNFVGQGFAATLGRVGWILFGLVWHGYPPPTTGLFAQSVLAALQLVELASVVFQPLPDLF